MRYELVERIGAGGMAEIFRGTALAAGGFEKPVAIKRILPHLSQDNRFVRLLIKEAQILSQLRHRNIVQIFDVGLGPDGNFFLVMEYVDGADIGVIYEKLEEHRKRLPVDMALHICAEVCEALDYAHHANGADGTHLRIVHRDVSPANIMMSRSGEIKLTDFGIAKHSEETTGHGSVRGKFAYISPEQARNDRVDARSDVYSLGIVLFELVLGQRLFSNLPDFDALNAVREGHIPRPRDLDREISGELEELLLTALAFEPEGRFASAGDFGAALRNYRYSLSSSGGDPAKEISRILGKLAPQDDRQNHHEPTVVRIETAAGFTASSLHSIATESDADPFASARQLLDGFDEEETHALDDDRHEADRAITAKRDIFPAPESESGIEQPDTIERRVEPVGPRQASPTRRDVFSSSELRSPATPSRNVARPAATTGDPTVPAPMVAMTPAHMAAFHQARRKQIALLVLSAMAVAVASFLIAQAIIGGDDKALSSRPATDAGPTLTRDAGEEEIEMPPDPIEPSKKKKQRTKRGKRTKK